LGVLEIRPADFKLRHGTEIPWGNPAASRGEPR
jgi:hypothetical protein